LHLHPYYQQTFAWQPEHLPVASSQWKRLISLPLFPGMEEEEQQHVIHTVRDLCKENQRPDAS
jgi:dTDP-4-amino-4,6-dideoxygalactose transaminase